jgi:hypothetical protein
MGDRTTASFGTAASAADRLCIICNERKPAARFERKGEHIVPRFLGNRRFRTPFVCKACNGGLGGTVDVALKGADGVAAACFNRGVPRARGDRLVERPVSLKSLFGEYCRGSRNHGVVDKSNPQDGGLLKDPAVKGAILKIAYESAHLRLGDAYLEDPIAVAVREILFAFVNKEKEKAHELIDAIDVYRIDINAFHAAIRAPRREFVKRAIAGKSCLNGIWLAPINAGEATPLAAVIDIEGLPPAYAVVGANCVHPPHYAVDAPESVFPKI